VVVLPGVVVGLGCCVTGAVVLGCDSGTAGSIGGGCVSAASAGGALGFAGSGAVDCPSSRVDGVVSSSRVWLDQATPIAPTVSWAPNSARNV
jgi:hypothetical protein